MLWFPSKGADDAPVLVICEKKTSSSGIGEITQNFPAGVTDLSKSDPALDLMQRDACSGSPSCEMERTRSDVLRYYQPPFTFSECWNGQFKVALHAPPEVVGPGGLVGEGALIVVTGGIYKLFVDCCTPDCNVEVTGKGHFMMSSALAPARNRPFERDWEIFIPGINAQAALNIAKAYFKQNRLCLPLIGVFIRFAPAEDGTLIAHTVKQGAFDQGPAGMFFEIPVFLPKGMYCGDQARYEKVYADLAEIMVSPPIGGRGHWGKNRRSLFQLQRRQGTFGNNMKQFREMVKRIDPKGMFANQFGVDIGLRWPQMSKPVPGDTETPGCTPDP
jgi:hypothetical protein